MRILAVTPYYAPEGGGLERYAHETLRRLSSRGHDIKAMANTRQGLADNVDDGLHVTRSRAPLHLGNAPVDPRALRRFRLAIRSWQPDVVLGHAPVPFPAEMACAAARKESVPFVLTYHAGRMRGSTVALDALATVARATMERRMFQDSRRLIAVSNFVRDAALAGFSERVTVVPPGVDSDRFTSSGARRGREILFVGPLDRAYQWKGVDVLWQAFQQVRVAYPDARLRLVGSGDRLEEFRRRADEAIEVTPRLSEEGLVDAYRRAAVTVLPSTTDAEAFGMVLAEANACGTPVVGSRIGGIPDFIEHGRNGFLASPGDAADLADKIGALLADRRMARRMGAAGRAKVVCEHDWDAVAGATEHVLETACLA